MKDRKSRQLGFTMMELIIVIIILGILSLYAASRYMTVDNFSLATAQEQAISVIRQIQLGRMQSNVSDINQLSDRYRLSVNTNCLGATLYCDLISTDATIRDKRSAILNIENITFTAPDFNGPLDFDLLGRPMCSGPISSAACTENPLPHDPTCIIIQNDIGNTASVCINSEGYVNAP